ncbi:MAG: hypothetical protein ACYCW6_28115, partial [Candidatus Xenobia bacterium]
MAERSYAFSSGPPGGCPCPPLGDMLRLRYMQAQVFQIEPASLPYHLDAILELFLEYASALNFDLRL